MAMRFDMETTPSPTTSAEIEQILAKVGPTPRGAVADNDHLLDSLNKLAHWAPSGSAHDNDLAIEWIGLLEKLMSRLDPTKDDFKIYGRIFRRLRKLCAQARNLPSSFDVKNDIKIEEATVIRAGFSNVYKGHRPNDVVAVKHILTHTDNLDNLRIAFCKEAVAFRYLRHANIVPFLGVLEPTRQTPLALISQWMFNGNLFDYLKARPEERRLPFMSQTLLGLEFIHSIGLAHGDLKAQNILVDDPPVARLADFGLSASYSHSAGITTTKVGGTVGFVAPELLQARDTAQTASVQGDIYAFASVLWQVIPLSRQCFKDLGPEKEIWLQQIFALKAPFWDDKRPNGRKNNQIIHQHLRPNPRPEHHELNDRIWRLMEKCWYGPAATRPRLHIVAQVVNEEIRSQAVDAQV